MAGEPPERECLSDLELARLTEDSGNDTGPLLEHILACDSCSERLKVLMEIKTMGSSTEEQRDIQKLASSSPRWQKRMAKRLAKEAKPNSWWEEIRWGWAIATTAAVVLVFGGLGWRYYYNPASRAERLLAQSYTSARQFEWRLPDAGWTMSRAERGPATVRPASLPEAQAILIGDQSAHENDPHWLELRARAEMLDLRFESAITLLQQALQLDAKNPEILCDLGAAYGLNADAMDRPEQFAAAVEYTTRALAQAPEQPRALFNRAIAFERLYMVDKAVEDWEHYLRVEKDPAWLKEARDHLEQLKASQRQRAQAMQSDESSDAVLEMKALDWLANDRQKARVAGKFLLEKYGDRWLADAAKEQVDSRPLLEAAKSILEGQPDQVLMKRSEIVRLYSGADAPAHFERARLEIVNALNRLMHLEECQALASGLATEAPAREYRWIQVQSTLQRSSCTQMLGSLGEAREQKRKSIEIARTFKLTGLEARTVGRDVETRTANGDPWASWRENRDVLGRLATSSYPLAMVYQCLYNYSLSAELWEWRAAGYILLSAAADALQNKYRSTEAVVRARAAGLALEAGLDREYQEQSQKAEALFRALPESETRTRYLNSVRLLEGESYLRTGRPLDATRVLRPVSEAAIVQIDQWKAHELLGLALARSGEIDPAVEELQKSAGLLETRVASLSSAYEKTEARRKAVDAYRALASMLSERDPSGERALQVWLSANGLRVHQKHDIPDLVFLALDRGYVVWSGHGTHLHNVVVDRPALRRSIARLLRAAASPQRPVVEIRNTGNSIYRQLKEPLADIPTDHAVTILPDAEIAAIPFTLLKDDQDKWLDESVEIILTSHSGNRARRWSDSAALVVGAPKTMEALPPLPDSKLEAANIASLFPGSSLLTGDDATLSAVLPRLAQAGVFHFSGHAYAGSTVGGLYLTDALLTSVSLQGLSLRSCHLAVLSACLTALGQSEGLTNPDSLVHSLLDAGVETVVASRWDVDSAATAEWMAGFYSELLAANDPAEALRRANHRLRSQARYEHPYYWAAFQVYQ